MSLPTVLITGATRGLGRAVAASLAADHHLILGGRAAADVEATCGTFASAQPFVCDLADEAATTAAVAELSLDRLDAVVHSAGVLGNGNLVSIRRDDWRRTFELNVFAVADLTRLLLPALAAARGTVVVINSGSGLTGHGPGGIYSASKFAARALTDAIRTELAPQGIRVSSIHPGRVDTDMQRELRAFEGADYNPEEFLRPESVAAAVRLAVTASPEASIDSLSIRPAPSSYRAAPHMLVE